MVLFQGNLQATLLAVSCGFVSLSWCGTCANSATAFSSKYLLLSSKFVSSRLDSRQQSCATLSKYRRPWNGILCDNESFPFIQQLNSIERGGAAERTQSSLFLSSPSSRNDDAGSGSISTDTEWGRIPSVGMEGADKIDADESFYRGLPRKKDGQYDVNDYDKVDKTVEVAIVGGGLAGLALAIGLSRSNIPFKLYERAPGLRSISQGMLKVEVNGLRALRSIHPELPDRILKAGRLMKSVGITNIDVHGNITSYVRVEEGDDSDGLAPVLIQWSNLQNVLASLIPNVLDVVCPGKSLVDFIEEEISEGYSNTATTSISGKGTTNKKQQQKKGVILLFEDGYKVGCNCLVGCDGMFSVVRRIMFRRQDDDNSDASDIYLDAQRPISFGQINWNSIIPQDSIPNKDLLVDNRASITMNFGKPTKWTAMINDCGDNDRFWQLRVMDPKVAMNISKSDGGRGGLGLEGIKGSLLEIASPSDDICDVIKATPEELIFERAIVGQTVAPTWCSSRSGKVVLLGDAAHGVHPRVGQGANSAFESVSSLLHKMTDQFQSNSSSSSSSSNNNDNSSRNSGSSSVEEETDWATAFQQYEKHRKPRADVIHRYCNLLGCMQGMGLNISNQQRELTYDETTMFGEWIRKGNPNDMPPTELSELLTNFDITKQPGVTRI